MKIAIHYNNNSFCKRWIQYCIDNQIEYKLVDAYSNNIVEYIRDCNVFLWHHSHGDYRDKLVAFNLLISLEKIGIKTFPNFNTTWFFDNKICQKYFFESLNIPCAKTFIFYDKCSALKWLNNANLPIVFKLSTGAGSANVRLIRSKLVAKYLIYKAFNNGFSQFNRIAYLRDRIKKYLNRKDNFLGIIKGIGRLFIPIDFAKKYHKEKGYIYFQEFINNNTFDIRVIVIGSKAFAIKRLTRKYDFRASGSGDIIYDKDQIDLRCVQLSFDINKKINSQCTAFDFIFDINNNPIVVEISYGFSVEAYDKCPGFWDSCLIWHQELFIPQYWMIDNLIHD